MRQEILLTVASISLLAGCWGRPCGMYAQTVWLVDSSGPVRVDVGDDWDDIELDAEHQVWAAHDGALWLDGDQLGESQWGTTRDLVRAGDTVAAIEWERESVLSIRDSMDAEPTAVVEDAWLWDVEAAGSTEGIAVAWSRLVNMDYDQEEVHVGWWSQGIWTEQLLLTGYGIDAVSVHGQTILVRASRDLNTVATLLGSLSSDSWESISLGEGARAAVLADDDSIWLTRFQEHEDGDFAYDLEHLGACTTAIERGADEPAIRPQGPGVDVYHLTGDGQPYRSRYDDDCKLLSSTPLDTAPDTTARFHGAAASQSGRVVHLGGVWWAESATAGLDDWYSPGCK